MESALSSYYRLPAAAGSFSFAEQSAGKVGFFRFGSEAICYGSCSAGAAMESVTDTLYDASADVRIEGSTVHLPFDLSGVIENLRRERYMQSVRPEAQKLVHTVLRAPYYFIRELLPTSVRRHFQRIYFKGWQALPFPGWPVDFTVDTLHQQSLRLYMQASGARALPFIWFWPDGAPNCLIMTHDVETIVGREAVSGLIDLDQSYGIQASFQSIPEKRYQIPDDYIAEIRSRGCEFNVHDLNHDGHLFEEREEFLRRAGKINGYIHKYKARGFRAGAMYRNQDWFDVFEFSYDMSVPSVAHLEPQRGGCCTAMPYFIGKIVELPLTTTQDYTMLHILRQDSIDLWKQQLALLRSHNGLMSFNTHPDYLLDRPARRLYESLLDYLREMISRERIWQPLPRDLDSWWRARSQMKLVARGSGWEIEGPQKERARVAYALLDGAGQLQYDVPLNEPIAK
jgi:hypothetical protein